MDDQQLRWVQKNRTKRRGAGPPPSIGELARQAAASPKINVPAWRQRLEEVIQAEGGSELLENVILKGVYDGVLSLEIGDPAVCYYLRLQWEQRLLHLLQAQLPEAGINAIRFVCTTAAPSVYDGRKRQRS